MNASILVLVSLLDGGQVNLKLPSSTVMDFRTSYGVLKIPLRDIRDCTLCPHVDNPKEFEQKVKELGSKEYQERAKSQAWLREKIRASAKFVYPLLDSADPEIKKRAEQIVNGIVVQEATRDYMTTADGTFSGELLGAKLVGKSESLGDLSIPFSRITSLRTVQQASTAYIKASDEWREVTYCFNGKLNLAASGDVDLFPSQPNGQWSCGPDGHSSSKKGNYQAGALLGRINGGTEFLVGRSFRGVTVERGKLELRINGTPWAEIPTGGYDVRID